MSDDSSLVISGGTDISPMFTQKDFDFLDEVDTVIERSIIQADPTYAFNFGRLLWKDGHLKGLALAKFLSKMGQQWNIFQMGDVTERIEDAVTAEIGISPQTVRKYSNMWESLFENDEIPELTRKMLYGKPIGSLLLLTAVARDGEDVNWEEVANASTKNEIRDIVREARGEQTSSKTALRIVLDRSGLLKCRVGMDGEEFDFGTINLTEASLNPTVKKAVTRIVERAGIAWA